VGDNDRMQELFGVVVIGVVLVGAIVAIGIVVYGSSAYDEIGRGPFSLSGERDGDGDAAPESAAVRDAEIRQLVLARNAHRERRGEAPLDVDVEARRLARPAAEDSV